MSILLKYFIANTLYKSEKLDEAVNVCVKLILELKSYFGHGEHEFIIDLLTIQVNQTYVKMSSATSQQE